MATAKRAEPCCTMLGKAIDHHEVEGRPRHHRRPDGPVQWESRGSGARRQGLHHGDVEPTPSSHRHRAGGRTPSIRPPAPAHGAETSKTVKRLEKLEMSNPSGIAEAVLSRPAAEMRHVVEAGDVDPGTTWFSWPGILPRR